MLTYLSYVLSLPIPYYFCTSIPISHLLNMFRHPFSMLLVGAFNKDKALLGAFSGHSENFVKVRCQLY